MRRVEFVANPPWHVLWSRPVGNGVVALMVAPLHWMFGFELCGSVVAAACGPLMLAAGVVLETDDSTSSGISDPTIILSPLGENDGRSEHEACSYGEEDDDR